MDTIEKTFANNLRKWLDSQPYGSVTKLAKKLGVKQGTVSNWAKGTRKSTETQRREVAQKIGLPYEEMIGIKPATVSNFYNITDIKKKHFKTIFEFPDEEDGLYVSELLVKIANSDPKKFQRLIGKIEDIAIEVESDLGKSNGNTGTVGQK